MPRQILGLISPLLIERGRRHGLARSRNIDPRDTLLLDGMTESAAVLDSPQMHNELLALLMIGVARPPAIAGNTWIYLVALATTPRAS